MVFWVFLRLLSRFAEGEDGEGGTAEAAHSAEAGAHGFASGDEVIDEEDVAAVELLGMVDSKGIGNVVVALIAALERLLRRMADARDVGGIHRTTNDLADTAGNVFRLVVTAFTQPSRMKRHRHNYVDSIEEIRVLEGQCCLSAELVTDERLVGKFHAVNHVLHRRVFLEEEKGGSSAQVHCFHRSYDIFGLAGNGHLGTVLQQLVLLRQRQ